ncbi:MAG TPA: hypothetical protein VJB61_12185, partial [Actinomycetota bacterium]
MAEPPVGASWETPGMGDDVRLRDVEEPDLEVFFEQQLDAEAARLANFPSRDRERFMTHWATRT